MKGNLFEIADTKRLRASLDALRKSEQRYRALVETTGTGFVIIDVKGRVVTANREYLRLAGRRRLAAIRGRSVLEWTAAHEKQKNAEAVAQCARRGSIRNLEIDYVDRRGRITPVEINATLMRDAEDPLIVSLVRDISPRRNALIALRESERRYWALVETTRTGFVIVDAKGRVVDANPEYLRLAGCRCLEEIKGRSVLGWTAAHERGKNAAALARCMKDGYVRNLELEYVDRRGNFHPVEINATVVEVGGRPLLLALCRDISKRRQLEQELLRIGDRERRAIGQDLHDDLGQKLTGVSLLGRALQARLAAQRSPEAGAMAQLVRHVDEVLLRTRELSRGLAVVPEGSQGLRESLAALAAHVSATAGIDCRLRTHRGAAVSDPVVANHLYRIAQEAVSNALRHGRPRAISISLASRRDALRLAVSDDGRGLRGWGGAGGLGLGIMRHRASLVHGSLEMDSRPGRGTRVVCLIPKPAKRGAAQAGRPLAAA